MINNIPYYHLYTIVLELISQGKLIPLDPQHPNISAICHYLTRKLPTDVVYAPQMVTLTEHVSLSDILEDRIVHDNVTEFSSLIHNYFEKKCPTSKIGWDGSYFTFTISKIETDEQYQQRLQEYYDCLYYHQYIVTLTDYVSSISFLTFLELEKRYE